jgi:hypothetical protein
VPLLHGAHLSRKLCRNLHCALVCLLLLLLLRLLLLQQHGCTQLLVLLLHCCTQLLRRQLQLLHLRAQLLLLLLPLLHLQQLHRLCRHSLQLRCAVCGRCRRCCGFSLLAQLELMCCRQLLLQCVQLLLQLVLVLLVLLLEHGHL